MKRKLLTVCLVLLSVVALLTITSCEGQGDETGSVTFSTLETKGTNLYGTLASDTESFSFANEIKVEGEASYTVSTDADGKETVSDPVSLLSGDNVFYLHVKRGETVSVYTVTLRRTPVYTVKFHTAGGTSIPSVEVDEGATVGEPDVLPKREGYTFIGWNYDFDTAVTEDITVSARWQAKQYTVTLRDPQGFVTTKTITVTYGESYSLPSESKTGYTFRGWHDENSSKFPDSGKWSIADDVELTAKWTSTQLIPPRQ